MSVFDEYRRMRYEPEDISPRQTELATSLRVPFVTSAHGRWNYVVCVVVAPTEREAWPFPVTGMPTDDEVRMVASYIDEYRQHWYNPRFIQAMADAAPYDIDGGACHGWLTKHENGGWGYRKRTWERGPFWAPEASDEPKPLADVLDRVHAWSKEVSPRWVEWKAQHPEVFDAAVPT